MLGRFEVDKKDYGIILFGKEMQKNAADFQVDEDPVQPHKSIINPFNKTELTFLSKL